MSRVPPEVADAMIKTRVDAMLKEIITKASQTKNARPSSRALLGFQVRAAGSWTSLNILIDASKHGHEADAIGNDCAAIFRCMYDAYIQAAYLFAEPCNRDRLGQLYLDYEIVERHQRSTEVVSRDNPFSQYIASSPLRATGEQRNRAEFERVKRHFPKQTKPGRSKQPRGVRNTWYEGDLRQLAKIIHKEDEYIVFVKMLHSSIHSGPSAVFKGPAIRGSAYRAFGAMLVCRIARLVIDNESLTVSSDSNEIIDAYLTDPLTIE